MVYRFLLFLSCYKNFFWLISDATFVSIVSSLDLSIAWLFRCEKNASAELLFLELS